ncbi:FAD-dependent monooxygenase [Mesobacillus foraminis]|uniref:FAD-dependent oxidoreductase n=1 Tax=Mesobacillus foraminis TaxID=279826 RepID=UPI001BE59183|nr:FAD-dependent monooxygenase [Mesobacillus foraminis]MBT2758062.1 FAD-dependent monooxygenase [Mesobacillus foraminis]
MRKNFRNKSINDIFIKEANGSAVVVGASLSGLMTGIALSRAGLKVTILERAGAKPRSGAVLQVDSGEIDRTKTAKFLRKLASHVTFQLIYSNGLLEKGRILQYFNRKKNELPYSIQRRTPYTHKR